MTDKISLKPWRRASTAVADEYSTRILDVRGNVVAVCPLPADGSADYEVPEANAARIVHCVNQHDALVSALEKIALLVKGDRIDQADLYSVRYIAKDAIAKAKWGTHV